MKEGTRTALRTIGIVVLIVGIAWFAISVFILTGAGRPSIIADGGIIAGIGLALILLSVPRRGDPGHFQESARDLASIFFTFGTLGPLLMMVITSGEGNFLVGFVGLCVSGGISVLWAFAFIRRAFWMIPIAIVVSAFVPAQIFSKLYDLGGYENFGGLSVRTRLGILGLESLASLVVGYVLMVRFIARVERAAAKSEAELETAARIHAQLVPAIERDAGPWSVRAVSLPSSTMGGDLVDIIARPDGGADLVLADVTGHGVRAGVVMALAKGVIWAELSRPAALTDAAARINRSLAELLDDGTFVTGVIARLPADPADPADVLVAGHPPPIVRRSDGATERVGSHGLPWGVVHDDAWDAAAVRLAPGDALVLYSDGITEAAPHGGPMLRIEGVEVVVARATAPDGLVAALLDRAETHAPGAMDDDRSAAVVWARSE